MTTQMQTKHSTLAMTIVLAAFIAAGGIAGCGDPLRDQSYTGPTIARISGTVPPLDGLVDGNPIWVVMMPLTPSSDPSAPRSGWGLGDVRADSYPSAFTQPITVALDVALRDRDPSVGGIERSSVTLFGVALQGVAREEALALNDFIAYMPTTSNDDEVPDLLSEAPVTVLYGYWHIRRSCNTGVPGPVSVFPLDGEESFTFTVFPSGTSGNLDDRAASCAELPLHQPSASVSSDG
jgi:hypothetical protein